MRIFGKLRPWLVAFGLAAGGFVSDLAADVSKVTIGLQGYISPKCSLSDMAGQLDFGPLSRVVGKHERALAFTVNCNAPFTYRISSAYGEMRNGLTSPDYPAPPRFTYQVLLTIPTDTGGTLRKSCDSAQIANDSSHTTRCEVESGDEISMGQKASLTVSWDVMSGRLLAGRYSDDLQISVSSKH